MDLMEMLNKKEVRCRFCNELVTFTEDSDYTDCDVCDTCLEWKHCYVRYKNGRTENLQDYLLDRLYDDDMTDEDVLEVIEFELADRVQRVSNKELLEKYGIEYKHIETEDDEDNEYIIVDKDKMKGKLIVTKFREKRFGSSFNWKTLGLMFDCYDEYKELLEKDWNEYCDEIMLNKYVEDEDEVYFGNVLAGTDKKTGNIDMWQCRIKLVEKISKFEPKLLKNFLDTLKEMEDLNSAGTSARSGVLGRAAKRRKKETHLTLNIIRWKRNTGATPHGREHMFPLF